MCSLAAGRALVGVTGAFSGGFSHLTVVSWGRERGFLRSSAENSNETKGFSKTRTDGV